MTDAGRLPRIPIYVDSPLATDLTRVFAKHPECYDDEVQRLFTEKGEDVFGFRNLRYVTSVDDSKLLNAMPGPMMVLAPSGMMEAGRVVHHLRNTIQDPKNVILIVGYMANHTLGRALLEGAKTITLFHQRLPVRARIEKINAYSAHADQSELIDFMGNIPALKKVHLVHGEAEARGVLATELAARLPGLTVSLPEDGVAVPL